MARCKSTDEEFASAVAQYASIAQVLRSLGLSPTGANYKHTHKRVARIGLDTSHWTGQGHLRGKTHNWNPRFPTADLLVCDSPYTNMTALKRRLIREALLEARCYECGINDWRGRPLSLVLDHINGVHSDHRIENLRLLCPKCNSQMDTFAGRNKGKPRPATPDQGDTLL
jgi:hypothetical protein